MRENENETESNQRYVLRELGKALPMDSDDVVRLKVRVESGGESHWVRVPHRNRAAVAMTVALTQEEEDALSYGIRLLAQGRGADFPAHLEPVMYRVYRLLLADTEEGSS